MSGCHGQIWPLVSKLSPPISYLVFTKKRLYDVVHMVPPLLRCHIVVDAPRGCIVLGVVMAAAMVDAAVAPKIR